MAYLRKAGFRFDKNLGSDLNLYVAGGFATRRVEHVLDLSNRLLHDPSQVVSRLFSNLSDIRACSYDPILASGLITYVLCTSICSTSNPLSVFSN